MNQEHEDDEEISFAVETNKVAGGLVFEKPVEDTETEAEMAEEVSDGSLAIQEELTLQGKIEAIIFASPQPLRTVEIHDLLMDH